MKNKTRKNRENQEICGSILEKKSGWITLEIHGTPQQRGYAHGYLLYNELEKVKNILPFLVEQEYNVKYESYLHTCHNLFFSIIKNQFPEFFLELESIVSGAKKKKVNIHLDELIAWNAFLSMATYYSIPQKQSRCSAFIATGNATKNGDIIMAHNTHSDFTTGMLLNIVLLVNPSNGFHFVMQTSAGFISSSSDWFLCSTGMIGCETTISNENYKTLFSNGNSPYFCRIRQAMQYGKTIDDYTSILLKNNEGDYPCSWLLGNINTGEIALFEIMQKQYSLQKTNNGVFYGMNSIIDPVIRTNETTDQHFLDLATSSGARNVRLNHLLNEVYYGKINMSNSKNILSDHYDSFLGKECLGGRCICKHGELNDDSRAGKVYSMHGCTDGKVVNTNLAKKLSFWGRIGSSCGRVFHPKDFLKKHPDKKYPKELQQTIVKQPWVLLDFDRKLIKNTTHIK